MRFRFGKLLLVLSVPVLLYVIAKGAMYFSAKNAVDDFVRSAEHQADIRYAGISTELMGAVTVNGITVQPLGYEGFIEIDTVRLASDDPMMFIKGVDWTPGEDMPPTNMSFDVRGVRVPLDSDLISEYERQASFTQSVDPCEQPLSIESSVMRKIGFEQLEVDFDGYYRIDETARTLDMGMYMEVRDVQSIELSASLSDLDIETLAQGGAPQLNLGGFSAAVRVSPEFGRQVMKSCAIGTDLTIAQWRERYAERALVELEGQGISLGPGLRQAVRDFYNEWGEFRLVSAPSEPIGLLSLMFLPRNQLVDALSLRLTLNDKLITDTRFSFQSPRQPGLSALFGGEAEQPQGERQAAPPTRIIVRREYEPVAVAQIARYVDYNVRIKPNGQPLREGVLKGIRDGEAEIEQTLHGGKYTVYVPLDQIDSAEALIQRRVE